MAKTSKGCIVWQWNCRSLAPKRGHLHQYLQSLPPERRPDVLAIQETWKAITIPGYQAFNHTNSSGVVRVTTLVRRNLPAQLHSTGIENIEHTFIEIFAGKKKSHRSTFILNVYSPPKARHSFHQLLRAAIDMAKGKALLIVGDFNAPHMSWGYPRDSAKGRQLWQDIATLGLDLLTDPTQPTRKATGGYKDTSPDLTLGHCLDAEWHNTLETLGSDHYILNILLRRGPTKPMGRPLRVVEWDTFRQELDEVDRDGEIKDLDQWTAGIREVEASATRNIPEEANLTAADSRLLHLWEMKTNLEARLRRKKGNRRLRKRIATLYKTIESHATYLTTKQWEDTCNEFEGAPNTPKTWNILRHLLDPGQSRTTVRNQMECILNSFKGDGNELVQEVQNKYIGRAPPTPAMEYTGQPNLTLDEEFRPFEVMAAIRELKTRSAPGPDGVSNKLLRHLDDREIDRLTSYFNVCWQKGEIPESWKTAKMVFIPKPGKKLQLEALRPISLTSCLGKVLEHVVLNRLNRYAEANEVFADTMVGFRPKLSTQDVMLRLYHQIMAREYAPKRDTRAILGLDISKAFDNVSHAAILRGLNSIDVGERIFKYIQNFLSSRQVQVSIGGFQSDLQTLGGVGTPQGAVLSPFLFNIAMKDLPTKLQGIPNLHHSIYADDVTLWMVGGSDGAIQDSLQEAIRIVEAYAKERGLACSQEKSELLLMAGTTVKTPSGIILQVGGKDVPRVRRLRILGLWLQEDGKNTYSIGVLRNHAQQVGRLIARIAGKRYGMKEQNVIRLIKAFVISRIAYIAPFLDLTLTERDAIDRIIRCVYKKALHLTPSTETKRLEKLGLHNTLSEIIEAQRIAHYERLSLTTAGRTILTSLGINYHPTGHSTRGWLPNELREQLKISPLPRHMHPVHDAGRRMARVKALENTLQQGYDDSEVIYVDAASADRGRMTLAVTNRSGQILTAGSMYTSNSAEAEEAAIALALTLSTTKVIVSDSQMAIRQYMRGHISDKALKIATGHRLIDHPVRILWSPAHASLPGNESAHSAACALTNRASTPSEHSTSATWNHDNLYTFKGVLDHYRVERRAYPEAHSTLNKVESTILRQVQTETFLNPAQLHSWYPDTYDPSCRNCGEIATLHHILWGCPELLLHSKNKEFIKQARQPGAWESFLRDPDPTTQKILVQLASDAAGNIAFRLSTEGIAPSTVSP
ncbi:uncharacterized protein ISCGN_023908 [Ixodes scapularis]